MSINDPNAKHPADVVFTKNTGGQFGAPMSSAPPLIDKLRAHGKASDSIAWNGQARQLLLWAADAIEAANVALSETGAIRDALEWYAKPSTYIATLANKQDQQAIAPIQEDEGEKARRALKNAAPQGVRNALETTASRVAPAEAAPSPACASPKGSDHG